MRGRLLAVVLWLAGVIPSLGAVTGTVMNADGRPVAGARVSLHAPESDDDARARFRSEEPVRPVLAATRSDARGRFRFESPKPAVVDIEIVAPGYAPELVEVERDEDAGAIRLIAAATKQGRITSGGKPVAGARVVLVGGPALILATDAEGRYSAPDPTTWMRQIVVIHPEYATLAESTRPGMSPAIPLDRTLTPGVTITGRVVGDDGKTHVAGAELRVGVHGWQRATSGEDGRFTLRRVPPGWESVIARAGTRAGTRVRSAERDIVVRLGRMSSVRGTVQNAKSQAALASVNVTLGPPLGVAGAPPRSVLTDMKGGFTFENVPPGSYELTTRRAGYGTSAVSVGVAPGETAARKVLMTQLARVIGIVSTERKEPVAAATLTQQLLTQPTGRLVRVPLQKPRYSAPDGTFAIRVDADADVQLEAKRKGHPASRSASLRLGPGERKSGVVITMPAGVVISGIVTDRDERPVADVQVLPQPVQVSPLRRLAAPIGFQEPDDTVVRTSGEGRFTMRLKEGTYDINFKRQGFAPRILRSWKVETGAEPMEVVLSPGAEIAGRVLRNGNGVEGVQVTASMVGRLTTDTAADGSFRFDDLLPGPVSLDFVKKDDFIHEVRQVEAPISDVIVELPPGGRLIGRVVDKASMEPITTFEAGIRKDRNGRPGRALTRPFTSDSGTFVLEDVPVGSTTVVVRAPGYAAALVPNVTVEEGKPTDEIEVAMEKGVRVVGRVTDTDGAPVHNVTVLIDWAGLSVSRAEFVLTDASGEFTFEGIEPGKQTFLFSRDGYATTQETVTLSGSEARIDAQLSKGVSVNGVVVTEGGTPVDDAEVWAYSVDRGVSSRAGAWTDINGKFYLEGLEDQPYTVTASKHGLTKGEARFDAGSGVSLRIVMESGGVITGRIIGLSPEELPHTLVTAGAAPTLFASALADASGHFRLEGVPAGSVRLYARTASGTGPGQTSPRITLEMRNGAALQQDIEFTTGHIIRGRVSRNGQPVAGASVSFHARGGESARAGTAQSDGQGNYEVRGLDDATYVVAVSNPQRTISYTTSHQVRGSGTLDIDVKVGSLRGRVTDAGTGHPVAGARVQVRASDRSIPSSPRSAQTDRAGAFVIESLPAATYSVRAEKSGYGARVIEAEAGDATGEVEIKLSPAGDVKVSIVDGRDGRPLAGTVGVFDAHGRVLIEPSLSAGTEPVELALDPGTYRATVAAGGYAPQLVTITSPSTPTVGLTPGGALTIQSKASTARRARLLTAEGRPYPIGYGVAGVFTIDAAPRSRTFERVATGTYTLQILGPGDRVEESVRVSIGESESVRLEV